MTHERTRPQVLQVMTGAWSGQAVYVAAKLGIADMLVNGPRSVDDLAAEAGVHATALYRILRALAGLGIFRVEENRTVELTPLAEPLATDHPDSMRQFAIMVNEEMYEAFGSLLATVRTGRPAFEERFGMPVFAYFDTHPQAAATLHRAMNDWSRWDTSDIVDAYDFSRFRKVVDVGGGNGAFLSALLAGCPDLSGVLLDRPQGIEAAHAGLGGPLPRCELVVGDFLDEVPRGADLYVVKHVIDGWPDDGAARILDNCRRAMADGGRVVVLDTVVEPGNDPSFSKWLDLLMMAATPGGLRREADYFGLFARAGLRLSRLEPISESLTLVEGVAR
ncbi:methyltransferase [Streptomyces sp. NPDC006602]|uniref:methyltransferase n=1 Tax=Streptomyces sp. NPDC006602 TaxID=3364751 RepID=UPI0036C411C2